MRNLSYWKSRAVDLKLLVECETVNPEQKDIYQRALEMAYSKIRSMVVHLRN